MVSKYLACITAAGAALMMAGHAIHSPLDTNLTIPNVIGTVCWCGGGLIVLFFGCVLVIAILEAWLECGREASLMRSGAEVMARIVNEEIVTERSWEYRIVECEFRVHGRSYRRKFSYEIANRVLETRVGDRVPVLYDPQNPELHRALGELSIVCDQQHRLPYS